MPTTPASSVPEPERTRKRSSSLPPAKQLAEVRKQLPTVVHVSIDIEDNSPDSPEREEDRNVVRMRGFASMPDEISRRMLQQRLQSDGGGRTVQRVAFETSKMKPVCHITFDSESNATQFVHHVNAAGGFRLNSDTLLTAELLERKCNNTSNRNREVPLDTRLYLVSGLSAKITDELLVTYFGPVLDHDSDDCLFIIYRWATLDRVLVRFKRPKDGYVTLHCEISGFLVDPSLVLSIRPLKQPTTLQVFCSQFASRNKDALDTFVHFLERNSWSADYELCRDKQFACLLVRFDDTNDAQFLLQRATNLLLPFHYVIYPQNDEVQHAVPRSAILRYVPEDADRVCRLQFPVLLDKDWISFLEFLKTRRSQFERKVRESHNVDVTLCADQLAREAGLVQLELQKAEEDELVCLDEWLAAQQNLALEILNSHFAKFSIAVKMGTWSAVTDKLAKDNLTPELFASKGIELVFRYPNIKICGPKDPCSDLYAQLCRLLQEQMQS